MMIIFNLHEVRKYFKRFTNFERVLSKNVQFLQSKRAFKLGNHFHMVATTNK